MLTCVECGIDETDVDTSDLEVAFVRDRDGVVWCSSCSDLSDHLAAAGGHTSRRSEAGSATMWVVFMSVVMLALAGLVIDGSYKMEAKRDASRIAEQAARAGADQLNTDSLRTGGDEVLAGSARAAASRYVAGAGLRGQVAVDGGEVTVTVTKRTKSVILSAFGVSGYTVRSAATATSIDDEDAP